MKQFCAIKSYTFDDGNSSSESVIRPNFYLAQKNHRRLRIEDLCAQKPDEHSLWREIPCSCNLEITETNQPRNKQSLHT